MQLLQDLVVISAVAVVVVAALQRLALPPVAGFIVAGVLVGPGGLGLIGEPHQVELLAEVGVVLLLFGIGLELSLERIRLLLRLVLLGGTLQMGLTILAVFGVGLAFGLAPGAAVLLGFLISVSSTAIVLRALQERGELEAPHGRLTLGVLVYQDLSVVPMILVLPLLAGTDGNSWGVLWTLLKAAGVLLGVVVAARVLAPRALHIVALTRQRNLFVLAVFLICLGTAWVVSLAGISLALGAFLAGLVVSGSDYRTQAMSDVIPAKEVLTSVFFVSVGMLLEPLVLWSRLPIVLALLAAIVAGKFLIMLLTAMLMRLPLRVAILSAGALAQVGEFSFVLARTAGDAHLLTPDLAGDLTSATIFSMVLTPLLLMASPHIAAGAGRIRVLTRVMQVRSVEESENTVGHLREHVIVAGLGVAGKELMNSLRAHNVPYVVVDLNADSVRKAVAAGEPAYFGDVSSQEVLEHLGLRHARELVLAVNDPGASMSAVRAARRIAPDAHIVVRTRYLGDIPSIMAAGASLVIPAELEAAVKVTGYILTRHGIADAHIKARTIDIRKRHGEQTSNVP